MAAARSEVVVSRFFRRYLVYKARYNYFRFGGSPVSVSGVGRCRKKSETSPMTWSISENLCVGFGISTLSSIGREIQLLPVWQPPSCVSGLGQCRDIVDLCCQFDINFVHFTGTINSVFMSSFLS
jgi:hypothetical protein